MYIITTIILPFLVAFNVGVIFARGNWQRKFSEGLFIAIITTIVIQLM
jgi:hypothetical protein